jgi:hypothetical protein
MERLAQLGAFTPPMLCQLDAALDRCLGFPATVVTADLWDVALLPGCAHCRDARIARLQRLNASGTPEPRICCVECGAS